MKKLAEKAGERRWQIMGARSQREATATYVQSFRRQISILLSRTMAQLMFDRLNLVVYGDRATEVERQKNKRSFAQWEEEDYYNRRMRTTSRWIWTIPEKGGQEVIGCD